MKGLRYTFYAGCLLTSLCGVLLTSTTSGANLLVSFVNRVSGTIITTNSVDGSLTTGLIVNNFSLANDSIFVSISQMELQWRAVSLLKGEIAFPYIKGKDVSISLGKARTAKTAPLESQWFPPIVIEQIQLDNISVNDDKRNELLQIGTLQLSMFMDKKNYYIHDVLIENSKGRVLGDASVSTSQPYNIEARIHSIIQASENRRYDTGIVVNGDSNKLVGQVSINRDLQGSATFNIDSILEHPKVSATVNLKDVELKTMHPSLPNAQTEIDLSFAGDRSQINGAGSLTITALALEKSDSMAKNTFATADFDFSAGINVSNEVFARLQKLRIVTNEGVVDVDASYTSNQELIKINTKWENIHVPLPEMNEIITSGESELSGILEKYTLSTKATVLANTNIPAINIEVAAEGDSNRLKIRESAVSLLGGNMHFEGGIEWRDNLRFVLHWWQGENIDPAQHWKQWPGQLALEGKLIAERMDNTWHWEVDDNSITGSLHNTPLTLALNGRGNPSGQIVIKGNVEYADTSADVYGEIGENFNLKWHLDSPKMNNLYPSFEGSIFSEGQITGNRKSPVVKAEIHGKDIQTPWVSIDNLSSKIESDFSADAELKTTVNLKQIKYEDINFERLNLMLRGQNSAHTFNLDTVVSDTELRLTGHGKFLKSIWDAEITTLILNSQKYKEWKSNELIKVKYTPNMIQLGLSCLRHEESSFCLAGNFQRQSKAWEINANATKTPLSLFQNSLPEAVTSDGEMSAEIQMTGQGKSPSIGYARADIENGGVNLSLMEDITKQLSLDKSFVVFQFKNGVLNVDGQIPNMDEHIAPLIAKLQIENINFDDEPAEGAILSGMLHSKVSDLSLLTALIPHVIELKGILDLNMQVKAALQNPVYDGHINVSDAAFTVPLIGVEVNNITFQGTNNSNNTYTIVGELHSGEGKINIEAITGLSDSVKPVFTIHINGNSFEAINLPEVQARIDPALTLYYSSDARSIEGELAILSAIVNLDELAIPSGLSEDEVVDGIEKERQSKKTITDVKVKIRLGEKIKLTGKGISGYLEGELDVFNNEDGIVLGNGEISIVDGEFSAYGQSLTIQEGRLLYANSTLDNPVLSIVAVREIGDLSVGLRVSGFVTSPDISLFSNSNLPQEQILSYIVFGRSIESLSSGEGADLLGAAASMGLQKSGFLTERIASRFGLDQLSISGADAQSASLVIGKYLNPKLYLSYGLGIFDKISTAKLRYDMSQRFSVEAERGSEVGVDVFYKIDK